MTTPTAAGWYDDPDHPEQLRYFDGVVWTAHVTPRRTRDPAPPGSAAAAQSGFGNPAGMPGAAPSGYGTTPGGYGTAPGAGPGGAPNDPYGWRTPTGGPPGPQGQQPGPWGNQQWTAPQPWTQNQGPTTPDGVPLAGYWQRVGAYLIDGLIQGLLSFVLGGYFLYRAVKPWIDSVGEAISSGNADAMSTMETSLTDYLTGTDFLIFSLISFLVGLVYTVGFWTKIGATPGKMAMGISVRERERPGPLPLVVAVRRYALSIVTTVLGLISSAFGTLGAILGLADVLWPIWDPKRQALHDKIAGTNVVRGKQPRR